MYLYDRTLRGHVICRNIQCASKVLTLVMKEKYY
jgi:hypothetical protein